jgi:hypothetical protein
MRVLYFLALGAVVYMNLAAVTLVMARWLPSWAIARAAGIVGFCIGLFFIEHFVGLGPLQWTLPPITAASAVVLWRHRSTLRQRSFLESEAVFLAAVGYGFVWKLAFPQIVELYDRLSDLHLVANYMSGARLPPVDMWLPWQRLDYYYAFQEYAAALLGRITGLSAGATFNVSAALLSGLVIALGWDFLDCLRLKTPAKILTAVCLAIGGTGISPLLHLIAAPSAQGFFSAASAQQALYHNSRFIGWFEDALASDFWRSLTAGAPTARDLQLPIETFGQQYAIGGYHAPLSGFLMLFLALATMARASVSKAEERSRLEFVMGFSVPLTICANAWVFPLQAILVGSWKLWDIGAAPLRHLRYCLAGAAAGLALILPFLAGFAEHGHPIVLTRVLPGEHSPWAQFLIVHWPLIIVGALAPFAGRNRSLALRFAAVFLPLLAGTELLNAFDGGYGGELVRFNPALKWWGWIFTGGVFTISACLLASERRALRWATVAILLLVTSMAIDVVCFLTLEPKPYFAKLAGDGFYTADPANARMLSYLKSAEKGLVLEKVYNERPRDTGIYGGLSGQPDLIGVPWIMLVWRPDLTELPVLISQVEKFYGGQQPEPLAFLGGHGIRYVVWSVRESADLAGWAAIDRSIAPDYRWMEFSSTPDRHVGLWIRRP